MSKPELEKVSMTLKEAWFELWWMIYPPRNGIRAGKQNAKRAFIKVIESEEDFEQLLKATEQYKNIIGNYAKDGERFLKNEYWRDFVPQEIEPENDKKPIRIKDKYGRIFEMIHGEWREVKNGNT